MPTLVQLIVAITWPNRMTALVSPNQLAAHRVVPHWLPSSIGAIGLAIGLGVVGVLWPLAIGDHARAMLRGVVLTAAVLVLCLAVTGVADDVGSWLVGLVLG
jgi:hypothetical protein